MMKRVTRKWIIGGAGILLPVLLLAILHIAYPLDLSRYHSLSTEVVDRTGQPLRQYLSADGYLRLATRPEDVDPNYIKMLIAYEDQRFYSHVGVDPLALIRATGQAIRSGHVVSGASTLTMQAARLLEPRDRTFSAKLIEMFRALQLEITYSKREILSIYLTLAPFGGNREGVRAASLGYFNRPPSQLTAGEAALLVALPQSPSFNRPDRHPARARAARDKILQRIRDSKAFAPDVIDLALKEPISTQTYPLPQTAPHLANRLKQAARSSRIASSIDGDLQRWNEDALARYLTKLPEGATAAVIVVENKSRRVASYVGSAHFSAESTDGYVDMAQAVRSPGSTLKPMIYGMALDRGLAHPLSLIHDAPTAFGDYQPKNFEDTHYGDVTLTDALQLSLNVPAVIALERIGPTRFVESLRREGLTLALPGLNQKAGLAVALGGVGSRLDELVATYAALAGDGRLQPLSFDKHSPPHSDKPPFLDEKSRIQLAKILRGVRAPAGMIEEGVMPNRRDISYKTGTSYGFRDAWAIGYNRDYTVGVWIGRPDGAPVPGLFGASAAAPFLFRVFDRLPDAPGAHLDHPAADRWAELPPALQRLDRLGSRHHWARKSPPPQITYPLTGSLITLPQEGRSLTFEATGGKRPFTWVVNGAPLPQKRWSRKISWRPDGAGFSEITLIDALGRRVTADIKIQ